MFSFAPNNNGSGSGNGPVHNYLSFVHNSSTNANMNIFEACEAGDLERVRELARGGVDVCRANDDGWTPMMFACKHGHLHIVQFLFQNGAKDDVRRPNNDGATPMWFACQEDHLDIVQFLFQNGAEDDVRRPDNNGTTPMGVAC